MAYPLSEDSPRRGSNDTITSSESMSRSSSKASSTETTSGKPRKPRRPVDYAERKSSIHQKRTSLSGQIANLKLTTTTQGAGNTVLSPPVSANTTPNATFTPILETARPLERNALANTVGSSGDRVVEIPSPPYYTLCVPTRPVHDVARAPATQMYWHQPPIHGMLSSAPLRRSHAIAQIGSSFYIFGGSDGKPPKATNTMYIFDAGRSGTH
jgi:hypothetical protein